MFIIYEINMKLIINLDLRYNFNIDRSVLIWYTWNLLFVVCAVCERTAIVIFMTSFIEYISNTYIIRNQVVLVFQKRNGTKFGKDS